jgi:hypothetical protein
MLELDDSTLAEKGISFKIKRKNEWTREFTAPVVILKSRETHHRRLRDGFRVWGFGTFSDKLLANVRQQCAHKLGLLFMSRVSEKDDCHIEQSGNILTKGAVLQDFSTKYDFTQFCKLNFRWYVALFRDAPRKASLRFLPRVLLFLHFAVQYYANHIIFRITNPSQR